MAPLEMTACVCMMGEREGRGGGGGGEGGREREEGGECVFGIDQRNNIIYLIIDKDTHNCINTYRSTTCANTTCPLPHAPANCVPSEVHAIFITVPHTGFSRLCDHCIFTIHARYVPC